VKSKLENFMGSAWGQRALILAIIMLAMLFLEPKFFSLQNLNSILLAIALYGIMAGGMLFTVLTGGMDLSVGSMAAMAGTILALNVHRNDYTVGSFFIGIGIALLVSIVIGLLHGSLVTFFGIPAFVVTLATQYGISGIVQLITGGYFVNAIDDGIFYKLGNARVAGVPMPIVLFVVFSVIFAVVLGKTTYGRRLYAVGGNMTASKLVGIKTKFTVIIGYVVSSVSAGIGGMILVSMNMNAGTTTAAGYEGSVLMAMVVGGINLAGGEGDIPGAIFGALLVGIINNIMILVGIPFDYQKFVQGLIIVGAVILNMYTIRRSQGLTHSYARKSAAQMQKEKQTADKT
jgi:ribose transport system permease protein